MVDKVILIRYNQRTFSNDLIICTKKRDMTMTIEKLKKQLMDSEEFAQKCIEEKAEYGAAYFTQEDDAYNGGSRFGLTYDGVGVTADFQVEEAEVPNLFKVMI